MADLIPSYDNVVPNIPEGNRHQMNIARHWISKICRLLGQLTVITVAFAMVAVLVIKIHNASVNDKDLKTFLHHAKAWNESVSSTQFTETQKKFLDQHQFTCFEMFTVKELSHIQNTVSSTCTELPKQVQTIVATKLSDKYKTRDKSFKQTVKYTPQPDDAGQGIGYQFQYSRMPYGEDEYRIILLVTGLRYTTSPVVYFVKEKETICEEEVVPIEGSLFKASSTQTKRICRDELVERRKYKPRDISQQEFETLITQKTKLMIQQNVIPQLNGELHSNQLSIGIM